MKKISALFVLGLISASVAMAAPEIGKPAPGFTLKDADGASRSLADFRGKTVVLEWFNYGCPFVQKHYGTGNMQKLQKAAVEDDVVWLSVVSSAEGNQGHLTPVEAKAKEKELGSNATAILLDGDGTVGKLYGAKTTPDMYVIDAKGTLIYTGAIDDKRDTNPASIEGATNYVTAALAALDAGKAVATPVTQSYGCSVKY